MSFCTTTVSNSVRKIAPVGHASRHGALAQCLQTSLIMSQDRKSTRLNSSHLVISYAVFCLKKKKESLAIYVRVGHVGPLDTAAADNQNYRRFQLLSVCHRGRTTRAIKQSCGLALRATSAR